LPGELVANLSSPLVFESCRTGSYAYCNIAASDYIDDDSTVGEQKSIEITKKYRDKIQNEMTSEQIEKAQTKSREILKEIENNKKKEKDE